MTGAKSYERIRYKDVWDYIDIEYYYSGLHLKYDIIVHPGGDPGNIDLGISGHSDLDIDGDTLSISLLNMASIMDKDLKAMSDEREDVPVEFKRTGKDSYGFDVDKEPYETLVIDPLIYSTVLTGAGYPVDFAKDETNCTYIFSMIYGPPPLITPGVYNTTYWGVDYYLLKMNSTGTGVVFATVIGGYTADQPVAVKVDSCHDIYIGGNSASPDFPTTSGVIQETHKSADDFTITKLNSTGDRLIYSTFIGGSSGDLLGDIGVYNGCVYFTGYANSKDIPSKMGSIGGIHGILYFSMINQNGTDFLDSAFWDGFYTEYSTCLKIDSNGEAIIGGYTSSSDFPTTMHSYQNLATNSLSNGFIIRYDPFGMGTVFSSIVGPCSVQDLALDENSDIVFTGLVRWDPYDSKPSFPLTKGTFGEDFFGYNDIFISKLNGNGTRLLWTTVVGGSQNETDPSICLDRVGNIYIMGKTQSDDHPTTQLCYDSSLGGEDDAFFFKLSPNGSSLKYSSYLGMNGTEGSLNILLEDMNIISLLGTTSSGNFPITNGSFTLKNASEGGIFLSIFTISTTPGQTLNLTAVEGDGNITLFWDPPIDDGNEPITNYQIYRGPDPINLTRYELTGPGEEFQDANVGFGIEYYYSVAAVNKIGEGDISNVAWNISSTIPDPPVHLRTEVSIGYILVTFEPPSFTGGVDITGYELYRNGKSIAELEPSENSFLDTQIGPGVDYTYNATSWNRNGGSLMSKGVVVRSKSLPSPPANFTARALGDRVVLRWEEPEDFGGLDITKYVLYKGISRNLLDPVRSLDPETVLFEDQFVQKGDEYFYTISAFNEIGGSESAPVVMVVPMSIPSNPCNPLATPGIGYINISWSAPMDNGGNDNISFRLYHGTAELQARLLVELDGATMQFLHSGIEAGIKHYYFVTAVNDIGESEGGDVVFASIIPVPLPPSEIELEPGPGSIRILWERPPNPGPVAAHEYVIIRRTKETGPSEIANVRPEARCFTDESVNRRTLYFYSIRTETDVGTSEPSREVSGVPLSYPDPPANVRVGIGSLGLEVSWDPPVYNGSVDITWYSVFRKDLSGVNVLLRHVDGDTTGTT
ncbi:MAG: SBBP repeat-containing protein, partial [Candidatus Thermoplasmatota archaeon]|nr:SBBP repeat-containing protein [Candidatus Thermoplasmatota archaeon]